LRGSRGLSMRSFDIHRPDALQREVGAS